jgi:hypothetical protein
MSIGRGALWGAADVAALNALETRLEVQETARSAGHGGQLRTVLELAAFYAGRGSAVVTVSHAALVLGCSEHRASGLLDEAQGWRSCPGGGGGGVRLLRVEQSAVLVRQLAVLPLTGRVAVWRRLQARLITDATPGRCCHRPG